MLTPEIRSQLQGYAVHIVRPVQITTSFDGRAASDEMRAFVADIAALSPLISVIEASVPAMRSPCFGLGSPGAAPRIRFAALPMGHEFTSFVLALLQVGGHPPKVEVSVLEQIARLEGPLEFETFVSLSCQLCPDVVQALNLLALVNPGIQHTTIDGALFTEEAEARQVLSGPSVFLNGKPFGQGRMDLKDFLGRLAAAPSAPPAVREPYDVLVVGGGPAGAAAAVYAARKGVRTGLLAERMGGQLLDTQGIENFISVTHTEGAKLARDLEGHVAAYGVELIDRQRAQTLIPDALIKLRTATGEELKARSVILATGARWRELGVPGEQQYRNRGVAYCPHCDGPLFRGKAVAVAGGGNSGVEAAIDLAGLASHITLLEFAPALRADAILVSKLRSLPNVTVRTSVSITEVLGDGAKVTGVRLKDLAAAREETVLVAGIFVQIGLLPNTDWLQGTVVLSARGEIEVDAKGQTSIPGVFAAGDCTTSPFKQIVIAAGDGAKASLGAFEHLIRTPVAA
jgi:alkyl hydroperoxide reductase subunit F